MAAFPAHVRLTLESGHSWRVYECTLVLSRSSNPLRKIDDIASAARRPAIFPADVDAERLGFADHRLLRVRIIRKDAADHIGSQAIEDRAPELFLFFGQEVFAVRVFDVGDEEGRRDRRRVLGLPPCSTPHEPWIMRAVLGILTSEA